MNPPFVLFAGVIAVVAAVRSTWSPCGQSMLSTITPIGERSRGASFLVTATWFAVGATLGGMTLGLVAGALAVATSALALDATVAVLVALLATLLAVAVEVGVLGPPLPYLRRQVNERWLDRYRAWLYGLGFGWQIGVGITTYVMTTALPLMIVLTSLSADPVVAVTIATSFGALRGAAVFIGGGATSLSRLAELHVRFDRLGGISRAMVVVAELGVALAAAALVGGLVLALLVAILGSAIVVWPRVRPGRARPGWSNVRTPDVATPGAVG